MGTLSRRELQIPVRKRDFLKAFRITLRLLRIPERKQLFPKGFTISQKLFRIPVGYCKYLKDFMLSLKLLCFPYWKSFFLKKTPPVIASAWQKLWWIDIYFFITLNWEFILRDFRPTIALAPKTIQMHAFPIKKNIYF